MSNNKYPWQFLGFQIGNAPVKATPVGADKIGIWDSATGLLKGLTWTNLLATAKAYFDTLYITTAYSPVPTRQTVLSGPTVASGAAIVPNFLAATYAGLVVTTQNVSTGLNRLIATASSGDSDLKGYSSTNLTWPVCTANQTNYLFCEVSGGVLTPVAPTILPPIEQDGGTPSIVNGQYTYNIKEHTQYLGNGTSAVPVTHVKFGQVVAGAATITATVAYAYQGEYSSGYIQNLPTLGIFISFNHNIGSDFLFPPEFIIENTTTDQSYSPGVECHNVRSGNNSPANYTVPITISYDALSMGMIAISNYTLSNKTTGLDSALVLTSWKYKFVARRSWK